MEGDAFVVKVDFSNSEFQSTPSVWKVTRPDLALDINNLISIHTFRVEGDEDIVNKDYGTFIISIHTFRVEGDRSQIL